MRRFSCAAALAAALIVAGASLGPPAVAQTGAAPAEMAALSEDTVRALQEALNEQGIAAPVDGVLDEETYAAIRQYQAEHHLPVTGEPDAATLEKLGIGAQRSETPGMMGMTPPGMMQMMQGMMAGQGEGAGQPGMMMGPGMMGGQPRMPMMGGGMAMPGGTMMDPMAAGMMGMHPGMAPMAPGAMPMMGSGMAGPGTTGLDTMGPGFGVVRPIQHLSVDDVRHHFEHRLEWMGNARLQVGDVTEVDEGTIVAEIVTVDGSLVDRLNVDRHTGTIRRAE